MRQIMQHMPMLTLAKIHLQQVCVCSRRFVASQDNNLFQLSARMAQSQKQTSADYTCAISQLADGS